MKNKEKFAKEIFELAINGECLAVDKNNRPTVCTGVNCDNCILYTGTGKGACREKLKEWAEAEYIEKKVFTEEEKALLIALSKINWVAKDKNGDVYLYSNKPSKIIQGWGWDLANGCMIKLQNFSDVKFESVKWEDEEPTSREEVLKWNITI